MPTKPAFGVYGMDAVTCAVPFAGWVRSCGGPTVPTSFASTGMSTLPPATTAAVSSRATGSTVTLTTPVPQLAGSTLRHARTVNWSRPVNSPVGV